MTCKIVLLAANPNLSIPIIHKLASIGGVQNIYSGKCHRTLLFLPQEIFVYSTGLRSTTYLKKSFCWVKNFAGNVLKIGHILEEV
jgi:hypothetical protein